MTIWVLDVFMVADVCCCLNKGFVCVWQKEKENMNLVSVAIDDERCSWDEKRPPFLALGQDYWIQYTRVLVATVVKCVPIANNLVPLYEYTSIFYSYRFRTIHKHKLYEPTHAQCHSTSTSERTFATTLVELLVDEIMVHPGGVMSTSSMTIWQFNGTSGNCSEKRSWRDATTVMRKLVTPESLLRFAT